MPNVHVSLEKKTLELEYKWKKLVELSGEPAPTRSNVINLKYKQYLIEQIAKLKKNER